MRLFDHPSNQRHFSNGLLL